MSSGFKRRKYWRLYRTAAGNHVIKDELSKLSDVDYAAVRAAMDDASQRGKAAAGKKLRGEVWEVEADGEHHVTYRLLFAEDGHDGQMLIGVVFLNKKTQKTPPKYIDLAEKRLADWRARRQAPANEGTT